VKYQIKEKSKALSANLHYGRFLLLNEFIGIFKPTTIMPLNIAVLGGSKSEVEIKHLENLNLSLTVTTFGIDEHSDIESDLNRPIVGFTNQFDLVLCNQVLEHLDNPQQCLSSIVDMAKPHGFIWITCPASNIYHLSPDFYSAGYQSKFISNYIKSKGGTILDEGTLGSERLYHWTHFFQSWPSKRVHENPFLRGLEQRFVIQKLMISFKYLLPNLFSLTWSKKILRNHPLATESYVAAIKPYKTKI